jgi:hypothetical protein
MLRPLLACLWLVCLTTQFASAQDKVDPLRDADLIYQQKDFAKALPLYLAVLEKGSGSVRVFVHAAACYAQLNKPDEAFRLLDKAVETGQEIEQLRTIAGDRDFASLQRDLRWTAFLNKYLAAWPAYLKTAGGNQLRLELLKMYAEDQVFRFTLLAQQNVLRQGSPESNAARALVNELHTVDERNTARLKEIIAQHGWPGKSLAGEDGTAAAWLLVQHADADPAFQRKCLDLMKPLLAKGEIERRNFAYLTDRVLTAEGKPQLYGTQFTNKDGQFVPQPIEDEANVDKRRQEMGLEPLAEYAKKLRQLYQKPANNQPHQEKY